MNHSAENSDLLISTAMDLDLDPEALKAACRARFGCGVGSLTDAQVSEFIAMLPALAHTNALHAATGLGVAGPGGVYKPDASAPVGDNKCQQCGKPGMWISGAGRVLCHAHQDNY